MGRKKNESPKPRNRRVVGLNRYQELLLKARLRKCTPSEPWVEEQIVDVYDQDTDGRQIHYRYHDKQAFPPGGSNTAMVRCSVCGVFNPPNTLEGGQCPDHARHKGWGPSPSARAFRKMERLIVVPEFSHLAPEDIPSLRREIEAYELSLAKKEKAGAER